MNFYTRTMNSVVDFIEENIYLPLSLPEISKQFFLSEYHFSRMFKIVTGISLKQYILGRKLSLAAYRLKNSDAAVIDIAYEFGFEYPEVFSRAFKKQFGLSPISCRNENAELTPIPKAFVIDRDIVNYQGTLALKETFECLDEINLIGTYIEVDENDDNFNSSLTLSGEMFIKTSLQVESPNENIFYAVVNCHGDDSGKYTVFFGKKPTGDIFKNEMNTRSIPAGYYASFAYHGNMLDMRTTFLEDLYRWIMVKEIQLSSNGVGMINIFNLRDMENVRVLVPIRLPK